MHNDDRRLGKAADYDMHPAFQGEEGLLFGAALPETAEGCQGLSHGACHLS